MFQFQTVCFVLSLYILNVLFTVLFLLSFIFSSSYILIAVDSKSHAQYTSLYLGRWCALFSFAFLVGLRCSCWGTLHGQRSENRRRHTGLCSFGCRRQAVNLHSSSLYPISSHLFILWNKEDSVHLFGYFSTPWDPGNLWNLVSTLPWDWPKGKIFLHQFSPQQLHAIFRAFFWKTPNHLAQKQTDWSWKQRVRISLYWNQHLPRIPSVCLGEYMFCLWVCVVKWVSVF